MGTMYFGVTVYATIAAVTDADPEDLALVSEANTLCFRATYPGNQDAQASVPVTAQAIRDAMGAAVISGQSVTDAIQQAAMLHYNCQYNRDFLDERATLALGRIVRCALAVAAMAIEPTRATDHAAQVRQSRWEAGLEAATQAERRQGVRERHSDQSVYWTGAVRRLGDWNADGRDLTKFLRTGDAVCEGIYSHFLESLPPAHMSRTLLQMGEAQDHQGPKGSPRYLTLQRSGQRWIYTGVQCVGVLVTVKS